MVTLTSFTRPHTSGINHFHLQVLGCLVYGKNTNISQKFDNQASWDIFLGHPHGQKGYKIFDLSSKQTYVIRNITFHEHIFPYIKYLLLRIQT